MLKSIRDDRYIIICFDQELPHDNADRVISHTVDRVAEACRILSLEVDRAECLPQMTDHRGKAIENHRMNKVQIFFKPA